MHSERQWKTGDQLSLSHARGALTRGVGASQVLNKIDLPGADPERVLREIEEVIGLDVSNAVAARACPLLCRPPLLNPAASVFPPFPLLPPLGAIRVGDTLNAAAPGRAGFVLGQERSRDGRRAAGRVRPHPAAGRRDGGGARPQSPRGGSAARRPEPLPRSLRSGANL